MQKVRSYFFAWAAYKITNSNINSLTVLFSIAYILYLAFEEGSPFSNSFITILLIIIGYSVWIHITYRISFDFFSWSY